MIKLINTENGFVFESSRPIIPETVEKIKRHEDKVRAFCKDYHCHVLIGGEPASPVSFLRFPVKDCILNKEEEKISEVHKAFLQYVMELKDEEPKEKTHESQDCDCVVIVPVRMPLSVFLKMIDDEG